MNRYKKEFMTVLKGLAKFEITIANKFLIYSFLACLGERGLYYRREYSKRAGLKPRVVCLEVARLFEGSGP